MLHLFTSPHPDLESLETTELFSVSIVLSFPECHIIGIIQYVAFSDWLLSLSNMYLRFLHVLSWLDNSFLFNTEYSIACMYHSLFIHSPTEGYVGCFQFLTIMDKAASNIHVQVFVWTTLYSLEASLQVQLLPSRRGELSSPP